MSDITISFPPFFSAWVGLGEAAPLISVALVGLILAYVFSRRSAHRMWQRAVKFSLVLVGGAWLGGISFWAAGLIDQLTTAIYEARHHYRLERATTMAGIAIPAGSWVWVDELGVLYQIDTAPDAAVTIEGARWRGEIRLAGLGNRAVADRASVKTGVLAEDTAIQGVSCRAGQPVEFSDSGDALFGCMLAKRAVVTAEVRDAAGDPSTAEVVCAADREIAFRAYGNRLLERCVLAENATLGPVSCPAGAKIVLSGGGLDECTPASQ